MKAIRIPTVGLVAVACLAMVAVPASADVSGPDWPVLMIGGEVAMVNGPDILNPRTSNGGIKAMTVNPLTGTIYGMDTYVSNNGRAETFLLDGSTISTPTAPTNALIGGLAPVSSTQYTGAVVGGNQNITPPQGTAVTFNPDYNEGSFVTLSGYNDWQTYEWAVQDTSVGWGHTVEAASVSTAGYYANSDVNFGGYSQGVREGFAYLDNATVSGGTYSDVYRYLYHYTRSGNTANDEIRVGHVATGFATTPTDTTAGTRNAEHRKNSSGGNDYLLMSSSDIYGLAPAGAINGYALRGEVSDDVFDVYMLFRDDTNDATYLAAVQVTIPSDGSAMSWDVIDLDSGSANTYLQIIDPVMGTDVQGTAIAFDPTGDYLYVAGYLDYSTGNGSYDTGRIYILEATEVPEPATLALLAVGGLGLAGGAIRRRHR